MHNSHTKLLLITQNINLAKETKHKNKLRLKEKMEVMVQSPRRSPPTMDTFNFSDGTMSSPYLSAPSSPKRFGEYYLSAPASPSRISQLYSEFDDYFSTIEAASTNNNVDADDDDDNNNGFAFYVSRESDKSSRSAEELFDGGKIKPLKPENNELFTSHKSKLVSQKQQKKETNSGDPLASQTEQRRGRDRDRTTATTLSSSNSGRRVTRSHSPYRKSNYTWESDQEQQPRSIKEESTSTLSSNSGAALSSTSSSSSKGSRRWRLRDLLLFRSASEGRGSSKDPLKYSVGYKKGSAEEVKASSSFRSSDSSRRKGPVSAHELHYAMKKAESQDMKKRTFLPYKQGILGRLSGFGL